MEIIRCVLVIGATFGRRNPLFFSTAILDRWGIATGRAGTNLPSVFARRLWRDEHRIDPDDAIAPFHENKMPPHRILRARGCCRSFGAGAQITERCGRLRRRSSGPQAPALVRAAGTDPVRTLRKGHPRVPAVGYAWELFWFPRASSTVHNSISLRPPLQQPI